MDVELRGIHHFKAHSQCEIRLEAEPWGGGCVADRLFLEIQQRQNNQPTLNCPHMKIGDKTEISQGICWVKAARKRAERSGQIKTKSDPTPSASSTAETFPLHYRVWDWGLCSLASQSLSPPDRQTSKLNMNLVAPKRSLRLSVTSPLRQRKHHGMDLCADDVETKTLNGSNQPAEGAPCVPLTGSDMNPTHALEMHWTLGQIFEGEVNRKWAAGRLFFTAESSLFNPPREDLPDLMVKGGSTGDPTSASLFLNIWEL